MKVTIGRSSIKLVWIDTSRIWNLSNDLLKKLAKQILEKKIILVDTGQFAEMIERCAKASIPVNDDQKVKMAIYKTMVDGFIAVDHSSFLSRQVKKAMSGYVQHMEELTFDFSDMFDDFITSMVPTFDEINKLATVKWGTPRAFKAQSDDIVKDWQEIRKIARLAKEKFEPRRKREILGMSEALIHASEGENVVRKKNLVQHYLRRWQRASGNKDFQEMIKFFQSDYYAQIPYVDVHSRIITDLIVGNEEPRSSDYFDVVMVSMILPFVDVALIDLPMKNRIVNKLKLTTPYGKYNCTLMSLQELDKWLDEL